MSNMRSLYYGKYWFSCIGLDWKPSNSWEKPRGLFCIILVVDFMSFDKGIRFTLDTS